MGGGGGGRRGGGGGLPCGLARPLIDYGNGNVILAKMGGLENVLPYIRLI